MLGFIKLKINTKEREKNKTKKKKKKLASRGEDETKKGKMLGLVIWKVSHMLGFV